MISVSCLAYSTLSQKNSHSCDTHRDWLYVPECPTRRGWSQSLQPGLSFCLILFEVEHWASMVLGLNTAPSITMATGEKNQEARKGGCFSTGLPVHLLQSLARACLLCGSRGGRSVQSEPSPILAVKRKGGQ